MAEQTDVTTLVVDGRTVTLRRPDPEQILAWMGLTQSLSGDLADREQAEITEDVTLILDAVMSLFESDEDRRWFRRATVLGKAKLSDVFKGLVDEAAEPQTAPKPRAKVRRAGAR